MELHIPSKRNSLIPATFTCPEHVKECPLVIGFHGFQSSRHEFGMFDKCADLLKDQGIAMIRIDFPGNNDSKEPFTSCTLKNMHDDVETAVEYVKNLEDFRFNKIGLFGYSMGGMTALSYMKRMEKEPVSIALWSPGVYMRGFLERNYADAYGGLQKLLETAQLNKKVTLKDQWSSTEVSYDLVLDMLCDSPLQYLRYYGGSLFLAGGECDTILCSADFHMADLAATHCSSKKTLFFENTDHDLGSAWGNQQDANKETMELLISSTVKFFKDSLD